MAGGLLGCMAGRTPYVAPRTLPRLRQPRENAASDWEITVALADPHPTEFELQACRECGVGLIQGYYFGRPMSLDDLVAWAPSNVPPYVPAPPVRRRQRAHSSATPEDAPSDSAGDGTGCEPVIPVLPATVAGLWELGPDASAADLAALCERDAVLALQLLRCALRRGADGGDGAEPLTVGGLLERCGAARFFRKVNDWLDDSAALPPRSAVGGLWAHSRQVARWSRELGRVLGHPGDLYLLGLLHDLGRFAQLSDRRKELLAIERAGWETPAELLDREDGSLHSSHGEFGGVLARLWGLPESLVAVIENHHGEVTPSEVTEEQRGVIHVVASADELTALAAARAAGTATTPVDLMEAMRAVLPDGAVADLPDGTLLELWAAIEALGPALG